MDNQAQQPLQPRTPLGVQSLAANNNNEGAIKTF